MTFGDEQNSVPHLSQHLPCEQRSTHPKETASEEYHSWRVTPQHLFCMTFPAAACSYLSPCLSRMDLPTDLSAPLGPLNPCWRRENRRMCINFRGPQPVVEIRNNCLLSPSSQVRSYIELGLAGHCSAWQYESQFF